MTPQPAITSFPITVEGLKIEKTETEVIVFDEISESFHFLNPTSYSILNACNGSNTIKDIAAILALEFNCEDSELLFADVGETVELFRDKGLVAFAVDDLSDKTESDSVADPDMLMSFVINGVSMFPVLLPGDKALAKKTRIEDLKAGDIIVWSKTPGNTVVHRIASLDLTIVPPSLVTKGDLLLEFDEPLQPAEVLGKIVAVLRGGHVQWLRQIEGGVAKQLQPDEALPGKGSFNGLKVLDLRETSARAIRNIESVRNVSLVLLSPENEAAWSEVDARDVTSVITVPAHYRVYTGQPELLPELLEFTEKPLSILVSGQIFLIDFSPEQILKTFAHLMLSGQAYVSSAQVKTVLQSITTFLAGEIHVIAGKHIRWIGESLLGPEYQTRNGELPLVAVGELTASQRLEGIPETAWVSQVMHKDRAKTA